MLVYATRTFSNTLELILSSALLYLVAYTMKRSDETVHLQAGLAIKHHPKTPKTHLNNPLKMFFFGFFKFLIFYENDTNFSLCNRFFMNK
jgi:hypothetical protein